MNTISWNFIIFINIFIYIKVYVIKMIQFKVDGDAMNEKCKTFSKVYDLM